MYHLNRVCFLLAALLMVSAVGFSQPARAQSFDPSVCASASKDRNLTPDCLAMIKAFPKPDVTDIQVDNYTIGKYNFYKVGPDAVNTYDGPNGNVNGQIAKGFNFVNVVDESVSGWVKTQDGKWIKTANATPTKPSFFKGVKLSEDTKFPWAWILDKSNIYASDTPGGPASKNSGRVLHRYERTNIFATAKDAQGVNWYMIGPNQWVKQTFLSVITPIQRPADISGRWVAVDLFEQNLVAYEDDKPVFATLVSSGLPKFETPEGTYKVWAKLDHDGMSGAAGAPSAYALQSVPYVMYFNESISLHGTYWHDNFGYPRSHGCVNLAISDASYLFKWMAATPADDKGEKNNFVYVYATGVIPGTTPKVTPTATP